MKRGVITLKPKEFAELSELAPTLSSPELDLRLSEDNQTHSSEIKLELSDEVAEKVLDSLPPTTQLRETFLNYLQKIRSS